MGLNSKSDEDLMYEFQKGKESAFNILVTRYKDKLVNHIYYYVKSREKAEDIVQDAMVRVYLNKDKYTGIAKVSTWVYTIANNLAKTELTKSKRVVKFSISGKDGDGDFEIHDKKAVTDDALLKQELKDKLSESIDKLEDKFREIIILRDVDEMSYEDIGATLDIPVGTVKSRLNRARLNLRDIVFDYVKKDN